MKFPVNPANMSDDAFVQQFGGVYEHSGWIAKTACDRGRTRDIQSVDGLWNCLREIVEDAGKGPQLALLCAHPDLAGKLAKSGALTVESTSEQAGAGLDQCTDAEFAEFTQLNEIYKARFGFPFILAVKGRNRLEILDNFRARVNNSRPQEFREALDQVHQIARLRLEAMA